MVPSIERLFSLVFSCFVANELLGARPNMALDSRKSHTGVSISQSVITWVSLYQRIAKHKSYPVSGIVLKGFSVLFFSYFAANELLGARPNMALDRRKSHTGVSMGIRGQQHRGSVSHQITQGNDKK